MPYTLADAYDDLIDVQLCDLRYDEAVQAKQMIAETICKKFSDDLDAAIQRGDMYRLRALALRKQAELWRNTSGFFEEEAKFYFEQFNMREAEMLE